MLDKGELEILAHFDKADQLSEKAEAERKLGIEKLEARFAKDGDPIAQARKLLDMMERQQQQAHGVSEEAEEAIPEHQEAGPDSNPPADYGRGHTPDY